MHQLTTPTTLSGAILDPMLRADPVGPRITYYDDATGERIELSAVTLANWAAKTGNLLRDELAAGPASRVAILLPAHWQTAAVLFGVWWIGAQAILDDSPADVALCTADRLAEADAVVNSAAVAGEVAVLSLDPFGRPATGLPVGVTDYATAVRVHGDQIVPEHNPGPVLAGRSVEQILRDCAASAAARGLTAADRVLSTASWAGPDELVDGLLAILAAGASLVQVANPDPAMLQRRIATERSPASCDAGRVQQAKASEQYILISRYIDVNVTATSCRCNYRPGRKVQAMAIQVFLAKATTTVITGLAGVTAYEILKKAAAKAPLRQTAVSAAALGLRGTRKAEEAAESARLKVADVMAEARERIGEESPTPAISDLHDHDH